MVNRSGGQWIFQLIRPGAREVFLVGDFNGWSCNASPMIRNDRGLWELKLSLPPGVYHFRYFADGQWLTDYAAYGVLRNPLGQFDSVLLVEEQPVASPAQAQLARLRRPRNRSYMHQPHRGRPLHLPRMAPTSDLPAAALSQQVELAAARQRRSAAAPPEGIAPVITTRPSHPSQLAEF